LTHTWGGGSGWVADAGAAYTLKHIQLAITPAIFRIIMPASPRID
jgi:hypothetical protein